jgi:diguanylate cyclase (GGDEF)-like protein
MSISLMPVSLNGAALAAAWVLSVYALFIQKLVVRRIRDSDREVAFGWWLGGGICLGTGLWAQTLLTTLAIELPIKHGYLLGMVLGSWLPAVVIWGVALWFISVRRMPVSLRVLGVTLVSMGCASLVYMTVSSILLRPALVWHTATLAAGAVLFLLTIALAQVLLLKTVAVMPSLRHRFIVSMVLGSLLCASQLVMARAAGFPLGAVSLLDDVGGAAQLMPIVAGVALILFVLMHMGAIMDDRHRRRHAQLNESLAQAQHDLMHASHQDTLTRLNNRQGFDAQMQKALDDGVSRLAVVLVNLDGFKPLMTHFGHALGDDVLRQVAARLRAMVRADDVVARADGDEFLLLLTAPGDAHAMAQMAQRINDAIAQPYVVDADEIELTCSIGMALYPDQPNPMRLVDHANEAMVMARSAGGGVYCLFQEGMGSNLGPQIEMQRDLRHAVERNQLMLYYQPKIDAVTGQLSGVEALLRWKHPTRGMVSPAEFIPVAERFGLIGELGQWVLREACRQIRAWLDAGVEIHVAVNVSVHQLRQADLGDQICRALSDHNVPAYMLVLEITESVAMENIESSLKMFDLLDAIGVQLSIDDFGTGYSSLSYLRRLPAKQLKVDRCFVKDLDGLVSHDALAIVEAVVRLAHALGLKVVAEGVETMAQAQVLRDLKCDELQGFLYARPMPEYALLAWQIARETGARLAPIAPPAAPAAEPTAEAIQLTATAGVVHLSKV